MRKPKYADTMFAKHVREAFEKGELTWFNIVEWDTAYNGGIKPIPAFNTRELLEYFYPRGYVEK